jgi:CheY-like chemotaxis protein
MLARKVLLVDDSKSARFVLSKLLQRHDLDVQMVESAEAALDFLKSEQPDAIFMDHLMPGMDGLAATSVIKNNPATAHIPVVMCTSSDGEDYLKQARSHGALGTLMKPPASGKLQEILSAVNDAISGFKAMPLQDQPAREEMTQEPPQSMPSEDRVRERIMEELRNLEQRITTTIAEQRNEWMQSLRAEVETIALAVIHSEIEQVITDKLSKQQVEFSLQLAELEKQLDHKFAAPAELDAKTQQAIKEFSESAAGGAAEQVAREVVAACAAEAVVPVLEQRLTEFTSAQERRDPGFTREEAEQLFTSRLDEQRNELHLQQQALEKQFADGLLSDVAESAREVGQKVAKETASEIAREMAYESAGEAVAPMLDERLTEVSEKLSLQQQRAVRESRKFALLAGFVGMASAALIYFILA